MVQRFETHVQFASARSEQSLVGRLPRAHEDYFDLAVLDPAAEELSTLLDGVLRVPSSQSDGSRLASCFLVHVDRVTTLGFSVRISTVIRRFRKAGFSHLSGYYVFPSLDEPSEFVPMDVDAILAWDDQTVRSVVRRTVRRLLIRARLHAMLFVDALVIAQ
jgi:hypothetical protein